MFSLSNKPIYLPSTVTCELKSLNNSWIIWLAGPFGLVKSSFPKDFGLFADNGQLVLRTFPLSRIIPNRKTLRILTTTLINLQKMVIGAATGFKRYLRVRGVGYKFAFEPISNQVKIAVGLTHLIEHNFPLDIKIKTTRKFRMIKCVSVHLATLTNTLSFLRNQKKPDAYRGKGLRHRKEQFLLQKEVKKKKTS